MKKILFLIHDLGQGGAEKVLVNLVNNMDKTQFDITVITIFGGGINEQFLENEIKLYSIFKKSFKGNTFFLKLFSPKLLHKLFIREKYDIEVSYLEGPSARIISGCKDTKTKLVSWIHVEQHTKQKLAYSFRSFREAKKCYNRFDRTICVSEYVKDDFCNLLNFPKKCQVLYNTIESEKVVELSQENTDEIVLDNSFNMIAVGTLKKSKGYTRLLDITKELKSMGYPVHLYILGVGPEQENIIRYIQTNNLNQSVTLLGYKTNPYMYVAKCDLFVCSSYAEGFSTAATEALILGVPVCTVEVSGMKEMLGNHNEYGIVTDNSEKGLLNGIKYFLDNKSELQRYRRLSIERSTIFQTKETVKAVEDMFYSL